ncbi:MAG: alpha/beta fold hydrolase [Gammaproteobacteria bacterium]|nr:alpha/beta fold hydrolase [Gammaproteobacteria bacterium]
MFSSTPTASSAQGDYVVLLHGIGRNAASMNKMEKFFTKQGYNVLNIDYPSTEKSLEDLTDHVAKHVDKFNLDKTRKIHFVGYSMGGLLVRAVLNKHRPPNLGRAVLVAAPNQGSEIADLIKDNWFYKKLYGPAGQQLTTNQNNIEKLLGDIDYSVGVIAGDRSIDPVSYLIIPGENDGKVAVDRTKTKGMADHIIIHATHTFIMNNAEALTQAVNFLKNGAFDKTSLEIKSDTKQKKPYNP